jgi:hypothetical protein
MDRKRAVTFRELAGFILLTALLAAGLLSSRGLNRQHTAMASSLDHSSTLALSGQWSQARNTADAARQAWKENWQIRAVLSNHGPMEEIDDLFARMRISAAAGERADFARDCAALAGRIRAVGNAQRLSWQNVL